MKRNFLFVFTVLFLQSTLFAHGSIEQGGGFMLGFTHPVLGFDHLLAMLSVGVVSYQIGGKAVWGIPAIFVFFMLIGGILGIYNIPIISVELGISLSVILLGVFISIPKNFNLLVTIFIVGFFAIFHGHAHGTEMPSISSPFKFSMGFLWGTTLIHIVGVFIAHEFKRFRNGDILLRHIGSGIAGAGVHILLVLFGV